MANAVRKMAAYLGLVEEETYDNDEYVTYNTEAVYPQQTPAASVPAYAAPAAQAPRPYVAPVAAAPAPVAPAMGEVYRITTIHPRTFNDARRIGEDFRAGTPVIMNLSEMDDSDARRIVDFSAGLALGLHGSLERVTRGVFLLSPANVDIGAAARAQLREDPFFNQS